MGGSGSGPYGSGFKTSKGTVEQHRNISINQLKFYLNPEQTEASYNITIDGIDDEQERIIDLEWTNCNFGGKRPWFVCPNCDERKGKLYFKNNIFLCRQCHGLAFRRTQISGDRIAEADWEIQKIYKRLELNIVEIWRCGVPYVKPKNMQHATFLQLCNKLTRLKEKRTQGWINKMRSYKFL